MAIDPVRGCVSGSTDADFQPGKVPEDTAGTSRGGANSRQIGGSHYRAVPGEQHWDRVARLGLDYWQAMITRYVERWRLKDGIKDLEKARHFLDKYIELIRAGIIRCPAPARGAVPSSARSDTENDWHWQGPTPDESRCGANYQGLKLTDNFARVTCPECLDKDNKS